MTHLSHNKDTYLDGLDIFVQMNQPFRGLKSITVRQFYGRF